MDPRPARRTADNEEEPRGSNPFLSQVKLRKTGVDIGGNGSRVGAGISSTLGWALRDRGHDAATRADLDEGHESGEDQEEERAKEEG